MLMWNFNPMTSPPLWTSWVVILRSVLSAVELILWDQVLWCGTRFLITLSVIGCWRLLNMSWAQYSVLLDVSPFTVAVPLETSCRNTPHLSNVLSISWPKTWVSFTFLTIMVLVINPWKCFHVLKSIINLLINFNYLQVKIVGFAHLWSSVAGVWITAPRPLTPHTVLKSSTSFSNNVVDGVHPHSPTKLYWFNDNLSSDKVTTTSTWCSSSTKCLCWSPPSSGKCTHIEHITDTLTRWKSPL